MKCQKCGAELNDAAKFCGVCGTPVMNVQPNQTAANLPQPNSGYLQQPQPDQPKKKKKTKAIVISVIAVILIAAIVTGLILFFNRDTVSAAELEEAKKQFVPPAEAFEIDTSLDDPSNEQIIFTFDGESRIASCAYEVNGKAYEVNYGYDDLSEILTLETTFKKHVIKTEKIEYSRITEPDVFRPVDGYYVRLPEKYIHSSGDSAEPEAQKETQRFGIGRVIPSDHTEATSAPETQAATTGGQHEPQAIPEIPEDLESFVNRYGLYCAKDYDCRHAVENDQNILSYIVNLHSCVEMMSGNNLYPGEGVTTSFSPDEAVKSCPWDSHGTGAWTFDRQEVEWICTNIFHLPESAIDTFYQKAYDEQKMWRDDDYYYILGLGKGDPMALTGINRFQTDGVYYHVDYTVYEMNAQDMTQKGKEIASHYMVLEKKSIDGKEYWTMLYHSDDVPYVFEPFDING